MSIKLLLIAVLLAIVAKGNALKCYSCLGSERSDCQKGIASSVVQNCFDINSNKLQVVRPFMLPPANLKEEKDIIVPHCVQVTLEQGFESPYVFRTCAYAPPDSDVCEIIGNTEPARNCKTCRKDRCNYLPVGNETIHY